MTVAFRGWKQNPRSDGGVRQTKPKSCLLIFMDPRVSMVAKTPLESSNTLRGSEADVYKEGRRPETLTKLSFSLLRP